MFWSIVVPIYVLIVGCIIFQLISTIVNRQWTDVARYGNLESWRELLAALVTYAGPEDFATLCGKQLEYNNIIMICIEWMHTRVFSTLVCSLVPRPLPVFNVTCSNIKKKLRVAWGH